MLNRTSIARRFLLPVIFGALITTYIAVSDRGIPFWLLAFLFVLFSWFAADGFRRFTAAKKPVRTLIAVCGGGLVLLAGILGLMLSRIPQHRRVPIEAVAKSIVVFSRANQWSTVQKSFCTDTNNSVLNAYRSKWVASTSKYGPITAVVRVQRGSPVMVQPEKLGFIQTIKAVPIQVVCRSTQASPIHITFYFANTLSEGTCVMATRISSPVSGKNR